MKNILTSKQLDFLKGYAPKDSHYTSFEEIAEVAKHLELEGKDGKSLCEIRDSAVEWYEDIYDVYKEAKKYDLADKAFNAMLSVTAVIDHYKAKIGRFDLI